MKINLKERSGVEFLESGQKLGREGWDLICRCEGEESRGEEEEGEMHLGVILRRKGAHFIGENGGKLMQNEIKRLEMPK